MQTQTADGKVREEAVVRIACVQMEPVVGERERNVRRTLDLVAEAAAAGARLRAAGGRGWGSPRRLALAATSSA